MAEQSRAAPNTKLLPDGKIEVAPRAIATITARAVTQCYGVVGMAPRNLRQGVAQVLRREDMHTGIEVLLGEDTLEITLYVIIEYGTRIAEVARNVQEHVRYTVEHALGLPVHKVNVRVQGLRVSRP